MVVQFACVGPAGVATSGVSGAGLLAAHPACTSGGLVERVLKRDMTALFGVRRVLELEQTFLYLCLHDGGLLDMVDLGKNLEVKKRRWARCHCAGVADSC